MEFSSEVIDDEICELISYPINELPTQEAIDDLSAIKLIRIRYFYEFTTPFNVNCREEFTIYNDSEENIESVSYNLDCIGEGTNPFREKLQVIDNNLDHLEFHSELEEYSRNLPLGTEFFVIIEFGQNRAIKPGEFRTITLEYGIELESYLKRTGDYTFRFNLDYAPRTYIALISSSNKFIFIKKPLIKTSDGQSFLPSDLREAETRNVVITEFDRAYYFNSRKFIEDCYLFIKVRHNIQRYWFNLGILFGSITAFINLLLILYQNAPSIIVTFSGLVNGFLLIIRGWLFENDMERVIRGIPIRGNIRINYNNTYIFLIIILIFEIILSIILSINSSSNQDIIFISNFIFF